MILKPSILKLLDRDFSSITHEDKPGVIVLQKDSLCEFVKESRK